MTIIIFNFFCLALCACENVAVEQLQYSRFIVDILLYCLDSTFCTGIFSNVALHVVMWSPLLSYSIAPRLGDKAFTSLWLE